MLAPSLVKQIRTLLAEGRMSQRNIARMTGASRGTVGAIAAGRRPDYDRPTRAKLDEPARPLGPPERCPGCGGIVHMPCRSCLVRAILARASLVARRQKLFRPEDPLRLDLRQEHRLRYEQVRAKRMQEQPVR